LCVTGVQTCALPISARTRASCQSFTVACPFALRPALGTCQPRARRRNPRRVRIAPEQRRDGRLHVRNRGFARNRQRQAALRPMIGGKQARAGHQGVGTSARSAKPAARVAPGATSRCAPISTARVARSAFPNLAANSATRLKLIALRSHLFRAARACAVGGPARGCRSQSRRAPPRRNRARASGHGRLCREYGVLPFRRGTAQSARHADPKSKDVCIGRKALTRRWKARPGICWTHGAAPATPRRCLRTKQPVACVNHPWDRRT
jgi:hypothetical protein